MWKNIVQRTRPQVTIWPMRISYWITKATTTNLEYVTLIAFPLQQWFSERTSLLRYTYGACLVLHSATTRISVRVKQTSLQAFSELF